VTVETVEGVEVTFSRTPLVLARTIEQPDQTEIKDTPTLWNASVEDAIKYGGDLTRAALGAMNLRGDKRYTIVDTKVHMLAPGQYPALPGWHTDGTPRLMEDIAPEVAARSRIEDLIPYLHPQHKGLPVILAQEQLDSPRFHLLVTGHGCLTRFVGAPMTLEVPGVPTRDLYRLITEKVRARVEEGEIEPFTIPSCMAVEWDWWALHSAYPATAVEWRYLIRVTESDHNEPQTDLRKVIRVQNQVFAPIDSGW
jgi:hypothetical protein